MTTLEILKLDYRKNENRLLIEKALRVITPFKKYKLNDDITTDTIETLLSKFANKYEVYFRYIVCSFDRRDYDTVGLYNVECEIAIEGKIKQIASIHAGCIRELFAKIAIYIFSFSRNGSIKLKSYYDA